MRKFMNIFAAALIMLAAASCEKNEVLPDSTEGKVVTLSATIDNGGTKTSLGGWDDVNREYPVLWSKGDKIAVIQDDLNCDNDQSVYTFTLSTGDNTTSATFTCDEAGDFDPNYEYRAVYPASAVVVGSDGKFEKYSFSDTQIYAPNSFGVDAMPMETYKCKGANCVLKFKKNVFGVLKLQLKSAADEKVTSIVVTSENALNGDAKLELGKIVLSGASDENKKVTLNCGADGGVALNQDKATDFHIALPAGATGLKVLINTNNGSYYKEVPSQDASSNLINAITAGNILKMPELNTTNMAPAYIENGVYLGDGVALPAEKDSEGNPTKYLIWAPVNCGYDAQKNTSADKYDGGYNPCPNGWKVPSQNDVGTLNINNNAEILYSGGTPVGLKVFGDVSLPTENSKWIFLPADGQTSFSSQYWTSTMSSYPEYYYLDLNIYDGSEGWTYTLAHHDESRIRQMYIRCVKR